MSESARMSSFEALQDFRVALQLFCEEAKEALTAVDMAGNRLLHWLQQDRVSFWQRAIRDCQDDLAQAKADLFRKQLSRIDGERPDCLEEKKGVRRAQARLEEAEDKLEKCRHWSRQALPKAIDEFTSPARQLAALVEGNPPSSVIALDRILDSLDRYIRLMAPSAELAAPASGPAVGWGGAMASARVPVGAPNAIPAVSENGANDPVPSDAPGK